MTNTHGRNLAFPVAEISATVFAKNPFGCLNQSSKRLSEYTVMNIEPISDSDRIKFKGQGATSKNVSTV